MNRSLLDYADLSSDGLKTERLLVLKFIAWSNIDGILLYSDFSFAERNCFDFGLDRHVNHNERYYNLL